MTDPRTANLARILVEHSTQVAEGEVVGIGGPAVAEPLLLAVYEQVLAAGAHPILNATLDGQEASFFGAATDAQLDWVDPTAKWTMDNADCVIRILAETNTRSLSRIDPSRQIRRAKAMAEVRQRMLERAAEGDLRWALTIFPTHAYASEAAMSLADYEDFYYAACLADRDDPVSAWKETSKETIRLRDWIEGREEVHIKGPGTDLTLSIADRHFIAATGTHNMPDGEFFTGPVEDSAEGEVTFHLPTSYTGREVAGVRLKFSGGKVVDASAERNEEFLISTLDTDPGARFLGELGIGTNFGIVEGTKQILLDEKIGGTIHLAVGTSYPETGGTNTSAVHWDMICDLRRGGTVEVDGEMLQKDGAFVV
ncbi:MAG: aminopeptidase [Solirubrobacterales bacterium]